MKDKLGGQIMQKFVSLRSKKYPYLKDNDNQSKKAKGTEGYVVKRILKFRDFRNCPKASKQLTK